MKKFLSILMVLAMVLSLGITAFATESTGSITITNATIGQTYRVYKIFDATMKANTDGTSAEAVAYSIQENSQFFAPLFEAATPNAFFAYNPTTGAVTKKEGVNDSALTKHLSDMVAGDTYDTAADPIVATSETVEFEDLPYGYYLITSSLGSTVTINSNTPDVEVIDKNQEPVPDFDKQIQIGVDENNQPIWADANSANIGDRFSYRISFTATNYDGDKKIQYYQVHDEKGDAIWAEFNSFRIKVDNTVLDRGYYLSQGGINTNNWEFLGEWSGVNEADRNRGDAQWYLVHLGYDQFRITIPWLEGHELNDVTDSQGNVTSYSLAFDENASSKYDSPVQVEIIYDVVVEANAAVGNTTHGNRFNKAYASWTSQHETGSTPPDEVVTHVYGIGLLKDDYATGVNLAGAKFAVYGKYSTDADGNPVYSEPVYVIPTGIDGVYVVDTLGSALDSVSGDHKQTSRSYYEYLRNPDGSYILQDANNSESKIENEALDLQGTNKTNVVESQANGKLVVLGLKAGTYYLVETEAPEGYNAMHGHVELVAGDTIRAFTIFADKNGNVADLQQNDGAHTEYTYDVTHTVVHNSKGVELPSTGGEGTFWLITIGTLLAIGFAVFLITHKKMSIYTD